MIVVKIELHSAITGAVSEIGRMEICNDGSSENRQVGHYDGTAHESDFSGVVRRKPDFKVTTRRGRVTNYRRLDKPIWSLVARMLASMNYDKM